jgi:hypothetical protein
MHGPDDVPVALQAAERLREHALGDVPDDALQLGVLYGAVRAGYTAAVTNDVETVTGKTPQTFEAFARQHGMPVTGERQGC